MNFSFSGLCDSIVSERLDFWYEQCSGWNHYYINEVNKNAAYDSNSKMLWSLTVVWKFTTTTKSKSRDSHSEWDTERATP